MSDMYNKVFDILNSDSTEASKKILYGSEGIMSSKSEYYESIITSFIKKKETILPKIGNTVVYDIEKDIKDVMDIIFIWKYVENEWKKEKKNITKTKDILKSKRKKETNTQKKKELEEEIVQLTEEANKLNKYFQMINTKKIEIKNEDLLFQGNLSDERAELKKAICLITKIRNGLSHRNENLQISENLVIDNDIKISIPIDYINGFNKSEIIAKEEDKNIYVESSNIASLIMNYLDKNPMKITSFFANVDPNVLSYILTKYDNDIEQVYQLPLRLFFLNIKAVTYIVSFIKKEQLDNETMNDILTSGKNINIEKAIKIYYYLKEKNIDKDFYKNLAKQSYFNKNKIDRILNLFEEERIDTKYLKYIYPGAGFNINTLKPIIIYIKNNNIDFEVLKYLKNEAYINYDNTIKILKYINENNIDYNILRFTFKDQSIFMFTNTEAVYNIENVGNLYTTSVIDYDGKSKVIISSGSEKLQSYNTHFYNNSETSIKLLKYINDNKIDEEKQKILLNLNISDIDCLMKIIDFFEQEKIDYRYLEATYFGSNEGVLLKNLKTLKDEKISYDEIIPLTKVQSKIENGYDYQDLINLLKKLNQKGISLRVLYNHEFKSFKKESQNIIDTITYLNDNLKLDPLQTAKIVYDNKNNFSDKRIVDLINKNNLSSDIVKNIPGVAYANSFKTQELISLLNKENIDLSFLKGLNVHSYNYPRETMEIIKFIKSQQMDVRLLNCLIPDSFKSVDATKELLLYCKEKDINYSILEDIPYNSFSNIGDFKGVTNHMLKEGISLDLIKYFPKDDIRILNSHHSNIDYLANLVGDNYKKLKEFPSMFYTIDIDFMDKALSIYNENVAKSIFGTDDPKLIAATVYANNVLTNNEISLNRKEKNKVLSLLWRNIYELVDSYNVENIKKAESISEYIQCFKDMVENINIFLYNCMSDEIKTSQQAADYTIRKLRNSSAHIRVKPSKMKGFMTMYDQDDDGTLNYSIDIKPDYLIEIVHIIEEELDRKKTKVTGKLK